MTTEAGIEAVGHLRRAVGAGTTPGGVLAAGWGADVELVEAVGWAEIDPDGRRRPLDTETVFDLASLTKVTATLPVILELWRSGRLEPATRVADILPAFMAAGPGSTPDDPLAGARREVTVEHLLTHTAGLPSHRTFWELGLSPTETLERFTTEPLEAPPGTRVLYSDLGFILLAEIVVAVTGEGIDAASRRWVTGPLAMSHTGYGPRREVNVAATERGADGSARLAEVHDENAAALGGIAGHAGLFSTAGDLARYLGAWTQPAGDSAASRWLPAVYLDAAVADRTAHLDGHRGLGWTARHDRFDQLGPAWPETAVFHSGFTGTSLALDRPSGRWVVLLTNDVHLGRGRGFINPLRQAVHTALAPAAG